MSFGAKIATVPTEKSGPKTDILEVSNDTKVGQYYTQVKPH